MNNWMELFDILFPSSFLIFFFLASNLSFNKLVFNFFVLNLISERREKSKKESGMPLNVKKYCN